jgi:hypothetical protein
MEDPFHEALRKQHQKKPAAIRIADRAGLKNNGNSDRDYLDFCQKSGFCILELQGAVLECHQYLMHALEPASQDVF